MEWQTEKICANLPEVVDGEGVVAAIVKVLDVALLRCLVNRDNLTAIPATLIGGDADCVDGKRAGQGGALAGGVEFRHTGVEPLQGMEGWVIGLLEEHMPWTQKLPNLRT